MTEETLTLNPQPLGPELRLTFRDEDLLVQMPGAPGAAVVLDLEGAREVRDFLVRTLGSGDLEALRTARVDILTSHFRWREVVLWQDVERILAP